MFLQKNRAMWRVNGAPDRDDETARFHIVGLGHPRLTIRIVWS